MLETGTKLAGLTLVFVHVSAPSDVSLDAASHTPLAVANVSVTARHGHEVLVKPHPVGAVWP